VSDLHDPGEVPPWDRVRAQVCPHCGAEGGAPCEGVGVRGHHIERVALALRLLRSTPPRPAPRPRLSDEEVRMHLARARGALARGQAKQWRAQQDEA